MIQWLEWKKLKQRNQAFYLNLLVFENYFFVYFLLLNVILDWIVLRVHLVLGSYKACLVITRQALNCALW